MSPIIIEIAGEPRAKGRPRFARSGHGYTPAATRAYESAIRYAAQEQIDGRPPLEGALLKPRWLAPSRMSLSRIATTF